MTRQLASEISQIGGSIVFGLGRATRSVVGGIKAINRAWASRRAARQTYHQLMSLSDRELSDIGITRNAIQARIFAPAVDARANQIAIESAEAPLTAAEVARLSGTQDHPPVPANQNTFKQRSAS